MKHPNDLIFNFSLQKYKMTIKNILKYFRFIHKHSKKRNISRVGLIKGLYNNFPYKKENGQIIFRARME